jgi:hypothetical protein
LKSNLIGKRCCEKMFGMVGGNKKERRTHHHHLLHITHEQGMAATGL